LLSQSVSWYQGNWQQYRDRKIVREGRVCSTPNIIRFQLKDVDIFTLLQCRKISVFVTIQTRTSADIAKFQIGKKVFISEVKQ